MKNWKIKLAEAIEAVLFIVSAIILGYMAITKIGIPGLVVFIITVLSGFAFYVTKNVEAGLTLFTGKAKEDKVEDKAKEKK